MARFYHILHRRLEPFIFLIVPLIIGLIVSIYSYVNPSYVFLLIIPIFFSFVSILWGTDPFHVTTEKFFRIRGYSKVVLEYKFIKKFLIISIPFMILLNFSLFQGYPSIFYYSTIHYPLVLIIIMNNLLLSSIILAALTRFITQVAKKDFRFYFAKGWCNMILSNDDDVEKMKYLFYLLSSYNKYLERNLKIKINDIIRIYSIILCKDIEERNQIIKSICNSLQGDRLNLGKYLSSLQKPSDLGFYIRESLFQELKIIGVFLAAAIPITITIIQSIFEISKLSS